MKRSVDIHEACMEPMLSSGWHGQVSDCVLQRINRQAKSKYDTEQNFKIKLCISLEHGVQPFCFQRQHFRNV